MRKTHELHRRRRSRNWGVCAALLALIVLMFAVTIAKLEQYAGNPSTGRSWSEALVIWLSGDSHR